MNATDINPFIRLAMHSVLLANTHINQRIIFDYELIFITDGKFILNYNGQDFLCKKGDVLLICPGISHSFHMVYGDLSQPHIHFDIQFDYHSDQVFICYKDHPQLNNFEKQLIRENIFPHLHKNPILNISNKDHFANTFFSIVDDGATNTLQQKALMLMLLNTIIDENASNSLKYSPTTTDVAVLVKSYIDSNYEHDLNLQNLEQQFGYTKYHLERLFKEKYGIPIMVYRNKRRMEIAASLLRNHSVTETAQLLGYSSIYTFSRAFRNTYGISPTQNVFPTGSE